MLRRIIDKIPFVRNHFLTTMFILGFVLDNITLNRVDEKFDNFVLTMYVVLAMIGILGHYAGLAERFSDQMNARLRAMSPALMQYAFGGLLSGMLIFYGRSGAFFETWPYILIILGAIIGNETIKNRGQRLIYNLSIFFIGLFSYIVLVVPVIFGKMGAWIFVGSGAITIFIMYWFFKLLTKIVPNFIELQKRKVVFSIGLFFVGFNVLYFTNTIPPIPLSLKDAGIYRSVVRFENGVYQLTYEKPLWWEFYRNDEDVFHTNGSENIFCYAAVFAPTRLAETKIYHRWEYFDELANSWVEHGRYAYTITGGRGDGYRGYTQISNYREGKWRCTVETARGQALGRETVTVVRGEVGELVTRDE